MTKEEAVQEYYDNVKNSKFVTWLSSLTSVAMESHGITADVVETCGPECWWDYYDEGLTPEAALLEDMSCGE
ncbi:MAG: hypothetical protein D8M57_13155 [Candidatus Scalindua sp. AMX11]|nr:MAG: hypothetical protein DWQ00_11935 [Candidatus Scalindua sp.]NOG83778.1 hypothetical protein [Planctomycetota bacterium]RZV82935.1 MAG: hypothetical protein EX341_09090 [Candidatus Scalindua sp. SCAELEC01]TDE64443.1 MAG: hypothetical protein D8M57_13155 [Candidatus Scalindua sp. AMX11]GJQ59770.1 MAG: hypothetical protein SCALA701_25710 [Candidatus Scalindua sp.]